MSIQSDIQGAYVAFFNRPADPAGLAYWSLQAAANGGSLAGVINAFSASDEYKSLYGAKSEEEIVQSIYLNLFGREAETAGVDYWAVRLRSGFFNVGNIAWSIFVGAQHDDALAVHNKVMLAVEFTNALDTSPEIAGFATDGGLYAARTFLSGVTADSDTVAAARAGMEGVLHGLIPVDDDSDDDTEDGDDDSDGSDDSDDHDTGDHDTGGSTPVAATLTTAIDIVDGSSAADTFNATELTLTAGDVLTAGDGIDTLKIVTNGYLLTPPGIRATGLEILSIEAHSSTGIDTSRIDGLTDVKATGSGLNVAVTGLASLIDVTVSGHANLGLSLGFASGVVNSGKTLDMVLDGSQVTLLSTRSAGGAEVGTLKLVTKGSDNILGGLGYFDGISAKYVSSTTTLLATGTNLAVSHSAGLRTVDFTGLTGRGAIDFDGADGVSFHGSNGGNKVGIVTVTSADVLQAGNGDDWLYLSGNGPVSAVALSGLSGFEHVGFNASGDSDATMNVGLFQSSQAISTLSLVGGEDNIFNPTYSTRNLTDETFTLGNVRTATLQDIAIGLTDRDNVTIDPSDMSNGGSDVGKVTLTAPTVVFPAAWDYTALGDTMSMGTLTFNKVDVLALTVSALHASARLAASDLDTLVISGGELSLSLDSSTLPSLIASSGRLHLNLLARGSQSVTVTTGGGDDSVVLSATPSNGDKVQLGAGSDSASLSVNSSRDIVAYTATAIGSGDVVRSYDDVANFHAASGTFAAGDDVLQFTHNLLTQFKDGGQNLFGRGLTFSIGHSLSTETNIATTDISGDLVIRIDLNGDGQYRPEHDMSIELTGLAGKTLTFDVASEQFYVI